MGSGGALRAPPTGFGAEPRLPKCFPLFSALRMASPDTIILLIVDYRAAIGAKTPVILSAVTLAFSHTVHLTNGRHVRYFHVSHNR